MAASDHPAASGAGELWSPASRWIILIAFAAGVACRYLALDHTTPDTFTFLLPWYEFARSQGLGSLGHPFTNYNYTPFYSYLLLIASRFDGWAQPWHLIKLITFAAEFGCAIVAARIVALGNMQRQAPSIAFAAVWLAPTVLYNGAMWGQADALWAFFCLVSIGCFCRERPRWGVIAFGMAFAVKAQAAFLGPFVFAFVLRRTIHWAWLFAVPAVYFLVALPAWLLGQPIEDIASVYLRQAQTLHWLSLNAGNPWLFVPPRFYTEGVVIGMTLAAAAGLAISIRVARSKLPLTPELLVLAATVSLLLMPFLLPKMHDRFFYAFEVTAIVLACLNPKFITIAVMAQLTGVLSYFAYDGVNGYGPLLAAFGNSALVLALGSYAWGRFGGCKIPV